MGEIENNVFSTFFFKNISISKSLNQSNINLHMKQLLCICSILLVLIYGCQSNSSKIPEPGLDLQTTSNLPVLVGPDIISTSLYERDFALSPQGDEIIFTRGDHRQKKRCLVVIKKSDTGWGMPEILNISGTYQDIEPFYHNDGKRLYFASNRPIYGDSTRTDYNIWYSDRVEGQWGNPVPLDSIINSKGDEFYPSLAQNGNLYFTATRSDGVGKEDIFISRWENGAYQMPKVLDTAINSPFYEFNAYVSPAEDFIIFSAFGRPDDLGGGDLYISQRDTAGQWMTSRNLGEIVNSNTLDFCPFVDWNTRQLYFTSDRRSPIPETITTIEDLTSLSLGILNGYGNIYKISLDAILQ